MPLLLALMTTLAACDPPPYDPPDTGVADDGEASIDITWPPPERGVVQCTYTVATVSNFQLVTPDETTDVVDGQGHFHVEFPKVDGTTGYALCDRPYCFVDLSEADTGYIDLTAVLMDNSHAAVLDAEGERIEDQRLVNLARGECTEAGTMGGGY